jgi:hypothetical protein
MQQIAILSIFLRGSTGFVENGSECITSSQRASSRFAGRLNRLSDLGLRARKFKLTDLLRFTGR